jgi:hypothetical protein
MVGPCIHTLAYQSTGEINLAEGWRYLFQHHVKTRAANRTFGPRHSLLGNERSYSGHPVSIIPSGRKIVRYAKVERIDGLYRKDLSLSKAKRVIGTGRPLFSHAM